MKSNRYLIWLQSLVMMSLGGVAIACGGNNSNCLSDSQLSGMLSAAGITQCTGNLPPCGDQQAVETPIDQYVCAYYHGSQCGTVDTHGCNTYGHVTGTYLQGNCGDKCYKDGNITISDTGITCTGATNVAPCWTQASASDS